MAYSKLDLGHGFVKSIIRNQVDRDNYDKEIKSSLGKPKKRPVKKRERRPDILTYVLPKDRTDKPVNSTESSEEINLNNKDDDCKVSKTNLQKGKHFKATSLTADRMDGVKRITKDLNDILKFNESLNVKH